MAQGGSEINFGEGVKLRQEGEVFVLFMQAADNRFNPLFNKALRSALDHVKKNEGPTALVTTGEGRFFSNGLDLAYLGSHIAEGEAFLLDYMALLAHFLESPIPTVAAINGHCFAGGLLFALAHDYRVMRQDRGFCCMNEIDLGMPLAPGMSAVASKKLQKSVARDVVLMGKRFGGNDAVAAGIVDFAVPEDQVLPKAIELAKSLADKARNREALGKLKQELYANVLKKLREGGLGLAGGVMRIASVKPNL